MKLKYKIIALNVSTLIIMLVILGAIVLEITDEYNLQTVLNYMKSQGDYATTFIEQYIGSRNTNIFDTPKTMERSAAFLAGTLKKTAKCRVQIYSGAKILGDSEDSVETNSPMLEVVNSALSGQSAYFISDEGPRMFYYASPIVLEDKYTYAVSFEYDLSQIDIMGSRIKQILVLITILSTLIIVIISTIISNRITYPVKELSSATKQFSKGDFETRSEVTSNDEVGELSKTFNSMADNIQEMINKLNYEKEKQKYFFDNFTHEIRTPLTTIIGYSELLWKTDDEEVRDKSLFHITSEGKRMLKMIERLLELSKLKNFSFELNKTETDLKSLIEDVCDSMQYKAKRYNIKFNLKLENIKYMVDPDLFRQVVINLIDNSIKYSKSPNIDIALKKSKKIHLTITDHGCGMDPLVLESIFEPYYKIEKSRNSSIEGWGLGLSIVKEIVSKHEGTIEIHSYPSRGTKVEITI
ncbi:MAG: sensor histidine kinase [Bacillota bacterium]